MQVFGGCRASVARASFQLAARRFATSAEGKAVAKAKPLTVAQQLEKLRAKTKKVERVTVGLTDALIKRFSSDKLLKKAVAEASARYAVISKQHGKDFLVKDELKLVEELQAGYVNFYDPQSKMPYVPLAARGPWIITTHGAVIHDNGGYGMLGFGHNAAFLEEVVARPQVMANIMTPSVAQHEFYSIWKKHVGWSRGGVNPYSRVMCLNSGSEAVELSARITDVHAKLQTGPGGVHEGRRSTMMVLEGSFYGRTYRPARLSHSCRDIYKQHLASFQHADCHLPMVVPPNDIKALEAAFAKAEEQKLHIEALYMEPVMGEGNPGAVLDRAFYDAARRLTKQHHSLLIIDSIQAALRAKGALSICDYPGFETADAPDMETASKALNAGQFPLSVLALQEHIASKYVTGLYGNTKTTNPRGLDIAAAVLHRITPEVRQNILDRGVEFQEKFGVLIKKHPHLLKKITGSGLIQAVHLQDDIPMMGGNQNGTTSFLARCRQAGLGVINAAHTIKFTPHFELTSKEIDLMVDAFDGICANYPKKA